MYYAVKVLCYCRLVFSAEVAAMVCELGVACCTLLQIFSLRASGGRSGVGESELRSQMALGLVSLFSTFFCLVAMLMGANAALQAMESLWNTVRASMTSARASMTVGQKSATGARGAGNLKQGSFSGSQVVPVSREDEELLIPNSSTPLNEKQKTGTVSPTC